MAGVPVLVLVDSSTRKRIGSGDRMLRTWSGGPEYYWADAGRRDDELDTSDYFGTSTSGDNPPHIYLKDTVAYPSVGGTIYGSIYPQSFKTDSVWRAASFTGSPAGYAAPRALGIAGWDRDQVYWHRNYGYQRAHALPNEWCAGFIYGYSYYHHEPNVSCAAEAGLYMTGRSETPLVLVIDAFGVTPGGDLALGGFRPFTYGDVVAEYSGTLSTAIASAQSYIGSNYPAV